MTPPRNDVRTRRGHVPGRTNAYAGGYLLGQIIKREIPGTRRFRGRRPATLTRYYAAPAVYAWTGPNGLDAPISDHLRAIARVELGPFTSRVEAINGLVGYLRSHRAAGVAELPR
jgi:hypothetical protein